MDKAIKPLETMLINVDVHKIKTNVFEENGKQIGLRRQQVCIFFFRFTYFDQPID